MIPQIDAAIIGLAAHGKAEALDKANFDPQWLESETARAVVGAAIQLSRDGKPVNVMSVLARSGGIPEGDVPYVMTIWKNGYGEAVLDDAVRSSRSGHLSRSARRVVEAMHQAVLQRPSDLGQQLRAGVAQLERLMDTHEEYDPTPSTHYLNQTPGIAFTSLIPGFNDLLRGGYRNGAFHLYGGLTKHGKSTTLLTHAVDVLKQSRRVTFVNNENAEVRAVNRILRGLSKLTEEEVETKQGKTDERHQALKEWLEFIDAYLRVYNHDWISVDRLQRIARWDQPEVLIIDYLKLQVNLFPDRQQRSDPVGDWSDWFLKFVNETGICGITAGQFSGEHAKRATKAEGSSPIPIFGSARPMYVADTYTFLCKDRIEANTGYFRTWLDRLANRQDTVTRIAFDPFTWTLEFPNMEQAF